MMVEESSAQSQAEEAPEEIAGVESKEETEVEDINTVEVSGCGSGVGATPSLAPSLAMPSAGPDVISAAAWLHRKYNSIALAKHLENIQLCIEERESQWRDLTQLPVCQDYLVAAACVQDNALIRLALGRMPFNLSQPEYSVGEWIGEDEDHRARNSALLISGGDGGGDCVGFWDSGWGEEQNRQSSSSRLRVMLFRSECDGEPIAASFKDFLRFVAAIPVDPPRTLSNVFCTTYQGPDFHLWSPLQENPPLSPSDGMAARQGQQELREFLHSVWGLLPMSLSDFEAWVPNRGTLAENFNNWIEAMQE